MVDDLRNGAHLGDELAELIEEQRLRAIAGDWQDDGEYFATAGLSDIDEVTTAELLRAVADCLDSFDRQMEGIP